MTWDPNRYHQFRQERSAPFEDLLQLVEVRPGLQVIDLGCGTGELTRRLADHLPGSRVLGIDSSPEMLAQAAGQAGPGLRFEQRPIEDLEGEWDLIFSNAALHWVNGHADLIPRLFAMVRPGGQLVVQVPSNHNHPAYRAIDEVAGQEPFRSQLGGWKRMSPVLEIDQYAGLLYDSGCPAPMVFEKIYPHLLADAGALADWTSGTYLVPYFERLEPEAKEAFLAEYRRRLQALFPQQPVFFGFRRILFSAGRSEGGAGGPQL